MAEYTPVELEALSKITVATTDNMSKLGVAIAAVTEKAGKLLASGDRAGYEAATASVEKLTSAYEAMKKVLSEPLGNIINELKNFISTTRDASGENQKLASTLKTDVVSGLDGMVKMFEQNAGLMALNKMSFIRDIASPIREFRGLSSGFLSGANQSLKEVMDTQNLARFNFMALGKSIKDADAEAEQFPERMRASARALGLGLEEANKYTQAVHLIPDALKVANSALVNFSYLQDKNITISQLAQVGMKAWGLSSTEAARFQNTAFTQLNRDGESFINMLGEIHGAVTDSGVPFNIASRQILNASSSLGIFGKNADMATNVWKSFATTLSSSGVAVESIGKIVNQVTSSIAGMSVQNRAFISMMSGMFQGATALGGALKMELAMRSPGGLEQGLEALTGSLAKFGGGKVITLEEAAQNPQLEMQFVLQRQMLGKLTGITTTEQQNRVLEVLQGVQRGGISRIDGSKQLNDLMKRGADVQLNSVTAIEKLERTFGDGARTSNQYLRNMANDLSIMQGTGMGIRGGGGEVTSALESPHLKYGGAQAQTAAGNVKAAEATRREGAEELGADAARLFRLSGRELERRRKLGASPIMKGTNDIRNLMGGVMGTERRSTQRELIRPEAPSQTQNLAMIPAGMSSERMGQMLIDIHSKMNASGSSNISPTPENVRGTGAQPGAGGALPPDRLAAELKGVSGKTESTITIKLDSDQPKFRKFVMDLIEQEVPKYINGENVPE